MKVYSLILVVAMMALCCGDGIVVEEFQDASAAFSPGAAGARGWVPKPLPSSARNLRIAYSVETNEVWLALEFDTEDMKRTLEEECKPAEETNVIFPRRVPGVSWWPPQLVEGTATSREDGWRLLACDPSGMWALDLSGRRAYYWRPA